MSPSLSPNSFSAKCSGIVEFQYIYFFNIHSLGIIGFNLQIVYQKSLHHAVFANPHQSMKRLKVYRQMWNSQRGSKQISIFFYAEGYKSDSYVQILKASLCEKHVHLDNLMVDSGLEMLRFVSARHSSWIPESNFNISTRYPRTMTYNHLQSQLCMKAENVWCHSNLSSNVQLIFAITNCRGTMKPPFLCDTQEPWPIRYPRTLTFTTLNFECV